METISEIYTSPSFNTHSSNTADIADRVVNEIRAQNTFTFTHNDNQPDTNSQTKAPENEQDFEFPVICEEDSTLHQLSVNESIISDDPFIKTSPRYPLFDTSLLSDAHSKSPPARRSSLKKLFSEDSDNASTSTSPSSSSSSDELNGISPGTYCVWKPKTEPPPRGKHKKSNSISIGNSNESNQWKVKDLLKRSYSDDSKDSRVFLFIPPSSPQEKTSKEKVVKTEKTGKVGASKMEKRIPAYKSKIGNIRLQPYLPYREDQIAAFANFAGRNGNM